MWSYSEQVIQMDGVSRNSVQTFAWVVAGMNYFNQLKTNRKETTPFGEIV